MPSSEAIQIDTKLLRTFCTVVSSRSFTAASKLLGLSQPTVSQQIQALEQELGVDLLVRTNKTLRLTAAGEIVLQGAQQVLTNLDRMSRLIAEHGRSGGGRLIIGAPQSFCDLLLPNVVAELHAHNSKLKITVISVTPSDASERLAARELDFALMPTSIGSRPMGVVELGREEIVAVLSPTHALAARERLQAADLRDQDLILAPPRSSEYAQWDRFMLESGVFPRVAIETESLALAKSLVREGSAICVAPRWAALAEVRRRELSVIGFGRAGIWRKWYLAYWPSLHLDGSRRVFLKLCRERMPSLLAGIAAPNSRAPRPEATSEREIDPPRSAAGAGGSRI